MKILSLLLPLLFVGCASTTRLTQESVGKDERVVLIKVVHQNTLGDWSNSTGIRYRLDGKSAPVMSAPYMAKRDESGFRFVVVPVSTQKFGLDDVIFGYSGYQYAQNRFGENPLAEVSLPAGVDPVYVGTIRMKSQKKEWGNGAVNALSTTQVVTDFDIADESKDAESFIKSRGLKGTLRKSLIRYSMPTGD